MHLKEGRGLEPYPDIDRSGEMGNTEHYYIGESNVVEKCISTDRGIQGSIFYKMRPNSEVLSWGIYVYQWEGQYSKSDGFGGKYITESEYQEIKSQYPRRTEIEWLRVANFLKR